MTDTERLNWLEEQDGGALVSDDAGHWAVVFDSFRNLDTDGQMILNVTFFVKKEDWKKTVREAIDSKIKEET